MSKEKFTTLKSTAVPLPIENIDTDQIIPAKYLKRIERTGFGEFAFEAATFEASVESLLALERTGRRTSRRMIIPGVAERTGGSAG